MNIIKELSKYYNEQFISELISEIIVLRYKTENTEKVKIVSKRIGTNKMLKLIEEIFNNKLITIINQCKN